MEPDKSEENKERRGPEEREIIWGEAKQILPGLEECTPPRRPNAVYTLDEWKEYLRIFSEECGWDEARNFLPSLDEYLERSERRMTLDEWRKNLEESINLKKISEGHKDWCTEHGRMLLEIEGELVCPECKEAAEGNGAKLQELSENWIGRKLGNWECKKHGMDLKLNAHNELVCPVCVDELIAKETEPEEVDRRHIRKD